MNNCLAGHHFSGYLVQSVGTFSTIKCETECESRVAEWLEMNGRLEWQGFDSHIQNGRVSIRLVCGIRCVSVIPKVIKVVLLLERY